MVSTVIPVERFDLVIFGGTGDLAYRKIFPSLYRRYLVHQVPQNARIIGAARKPMSREAFQHTVRDALKTFVEPKYDRDDAIEAFIGIVDYVAIDAAGDGGWAELRDKLDGGET